MNERIVAAAIKFYQDGFEYPTIMCGRRHADVFQQMFSLGIKYDKKTHVQGFLTDKNRFVDRYDAFVIAIFAHQVLEDSDAWREYQEANTSCTQIRAIPLYSEDVW